MADCAQRSFSGAKLRGGEGCAAGTALEQLGPKARMRKIMGFVFFYFIFFSHNP